MLCIISRPASRCGTETWPELRLHKLTDWSHDWQMSFNVDKCKVMHVGRRNIHSKYYMNDAELSDTTEEKDLGVVIADNLMVARHCTYAYSKGNRILGMIKWTIISRDIHILLYKILVCPHLRVPVLLTSMVSSLSKRQTASGEGPTSFYETICRSQKLVLSW